jgi:hypothetical protein
MVRYHGFVEYEIGTWRIGEMKVYAVTVGGAQFGFGNRSSNSRAFRLKTVNIVTTASNDSYPNLELSQ